MLNVSQVNNCVIDSQTALRYYAFPDFQVESKESPHLNSSMPDYQSHVPFLNLRHRRKFAYFQYTVQCNMYVYSEYCLTHRIVQ